MAEQGIIEGYVVVNDGQFQQIEAGNPSAQLEAECTEVIHAKGKWMLPGFINTHGHTGMSLLRGHSDDLPLHRWLEEKMWPFEAKLDRESVKVSRQLAVAEMLLSGTTTFLEMYHLYIDDFAEQLAEIGMRATLMRSMIGLCPTQEQEEKLQVAVNLAKTWHKTANNRIQMMLAPHAPYTCPPAFIERIVEEATMLQLPIHIHLAETKKEVDDHIKTYGMHPFDHLQNMNVLDKTPWLFAHCVHISPEQIKDMAQYQLSVSYNPKSNLKLGSGIAPVAQMLKEGVNVSIGTDSVASNNTLDLFEELRIGSLLQKGVLQDSSVLPAFEALKLVTKNGAQALSLQNVGQIKVGFDADFQLLAYDKPHLQPNEHIYSHLVYAASGSDVTDVYVQGNALVRKKELLTLDLEKIIFEANDAYKKVNKS